MKEEVEEGRVRVGEDREAMKKQEGDKIKKNKQTHVEERLVK